MSKQRTFCDKVCLALLIIEMSVPTIVGNDILASNLNPLAIIYQWKLL